MNQQPTPLICQKQHFQLEENVTYLNAAYLTPQSESVSEVGLEALHRKEKPWQIAQEDFFEPIDHLCQSFASLIDCSDAERVVPVASASYGLSNIAVQIKPASGSNIVLLDEQFPSNYYTWKRLSDNFNCEIRSISAPSGPNKGEAWNRAILQAIDDKTAAVSIPPLHWSDGTLFDLKTIREVSRKRGALLILDGSQTIGGMPFSVAEIEPDALVTVGYKWLTGPYGTAFAYFGSFFDDGLPIEESWMVHEGARDFSQLVKYNHNYAPKARRYMVGQASNFITMPMMQAALQQVIDWNPTRIESYCEAISAEAISELRSAGFELEADEYRAKHLFGLRLPKHLKMSAVQQKLDHANVKVSLRGNAIRLSPHVYNDKADFSRLLDVLLS